MPEFEVNVRAIVRGHELPDESAGDIPGWEIYDFDTDEDGQVTIRCDQPITVTADSEEDAIKNAKDAATNIEVPGFDVDDIKIWVDEDIDVTLKGMAPSAKP